MGSHEIVEIYTRVGATSLKSAPDEEQMNVMAQNGNRSINALLILGNCLIENRDELQRIMPIQRVTSGS